MRTSTSSYIVELPLRVNDQQNRFLEKAFEFGRTLYNATLGTALGRLQRMRETQEWRVARDMPKGKARTKAFSAVHKAFGLTEFGLTIIANNHRKASGRKDIGAHEAQSIGKAVWRGLQRHMFRKAGRPRFKSFRRGLNSIEGTNNQEIMYKPKLGSIVWRKYMKPDTVYMKEALASDRKVKYCFKLPKWNVFSLKSERGLLAPPSGFIPRKVLSLSTRKRNRPIEFRPNQEKGGIRR